MCLDIKKDLRNSGILLKKVYKLLRISYDNNGNTVYITYFRRTAVPTDGVLRPTTYEENPVTWLNLIYGNVIHSFTKIFLHDSIVYLRKNFKAYALLPIAAGTGDDIASRALYIPDLDFSDLKEERIEYLETEPVTIEGLTRLFAEEQD